MIEKERENLQCGCQVDRGGEKESQGECWVEIKIKLKLFRKR